MRAPLIVSHRPSILRQRYRWLFFPQYSSLTPPTDWLPIEYLQLHLMRQSGPATNTLSLVFTSFICCSFMLSTLTPIDFKYVFGQQHQCLSCSCRSSIPSCSILHNKHWQQHKAAVYFRNCFGLPIYSSSKSISAYTLSYTWTSLIFFKLRLYLRLL